MYEDSGSQPVVCVPLVVHKATAAEEQIFFSKSIIMACYYL